MERVCLVLLLILGDAVSKVDSQEFHGYILVAVTVDTMQDVAFLEQLADEHEDVDFWNGPALGGNTVLLSNRAKTLFTTALDNNGITWQQLTDDVEGIVNNGLRKTDVEPNNRETRSHHAHDVIDHKNYHDYDEIVSYLYELEEKYPSNVEVSNMTYKTPEGVEVVMMKVFSTRASTQLKPTIIVEAGIHAREWISPAATLYGFEKLLQKYHSGEPIAQVMVDSYDWYVAPVTNPDGYTFTRRCRKDRFWRKNRREIEPGCFGVDLNRNFAVYHGTTGISSNCHSFIYPGDQPFSEPETANLRDLFYSIQDSVIAYLSVHSYSQFVLVPWAFSNIGLQPDNWQELRRVANDMAQAIEDTHGKIYEVGTVWDLLEYAASGSSMDWAIYTKPNIYALAYELRPEWTDPRGFNLPPDEIVPTGQEFLASLEALALAVEPVD